MGLLWTTLEPCICIINANLPMVRTYLAAVAPTFFASTKDRTGTAPLSGLPGHSSRNRPDNFELIKDERFGVRTDFRMSGLGTQSKIQGGRAAKVLEDSDSERGLTKGDHTINVSRSVDVESL